MPSPPSLPASMDHSKPPMPPFTYETAAVAAVQPTLAQAFLRLGALAGVDPKAVTSLLPAETGPEAAAFDAAWPALAPLLQPLRVHLGGSLLGRFLSDERFDGEPPSSYLPKEAKKALKTGEMVASADADVWIFNEKPDGTVQVGHAHPESWAVLGDSLAEWLNGEADLVEAARRPKSKSKAKKEAAGKPVVDELLARLVVLSGGEDPRALLAGLPHARNDNLWKYFQQALAALSSPWSPAVLSALEGRLLGRALSGKLHDTEDESCEWEEGDDDLDGINPIYVKRYPKESRKLIGEVRPTCFVASSGPEIWFILWEAKGHVSSWPISIHHAAYDGYELISPTLEGWLSAEVARVEAAVGA
jgi:hypothetical protein